MMQYAVNKDYNMSMFAWNDKNPVHIISTADSTRQDFVDRKKKNNYEEVPCPESIRRYNQEMGGVDRFNRLMSLFSMGKMHGFGKYYKKSSNDANRFCACKFVLTLENGP